MVARNPSFVKTLERLSVKRGRGCIPSAGLGSLPGEWRLGGGEAAPVRAARNLPRWLVGRERSRAIFSGPQRFQSRKAGSLWRVTVCPP